MNNSRFRIARFVELNDQLYMCVVCMCAVPRIVGKEDAVLYGHDEWHERVITTL